MSDNEKDLIHEAEVDVDKLMAEIDRESNTRQFTGIYKKIISSLLVAFTVYIMYITLFATPREEIRRATFVGLIIFLAYLIYPLYKKQTQRINFIPWYDFLLAFCGGGSFFYFAYNCQRIVDAAGRLTTMDIVVAIVGILLLFEICRRVVGIPILFVAGAFIIYATYRCYFGLPYLRITPVRLIYQLFYTVNGILGTPIMVCSTFIVLFIILGSFLEKTGIGTFFVDLANSIAGYASGGPAKVAVISSALEGMYSGSSVANTVGSGSITIPVMKKTGYKPEFAAAVEAAASTGGQIMPPIMGAAAFLMAENTGIPYPAIAIAAILPAILYFTGIFMMIHFEAKKLGLKGLPKESIPNFFKLFLHRGYLLLPIVVLVVLMSIGRTPAMSACLAILTAIFVSMFSKDTRLTPKSFVSALEGGTKNTIGVGIACAIAGIVVGIVSLTSLGNLLVDNLTAVANGNLFVALFLTMIACIILGMGVPTTANYVIMASITAPIVINMGVPLLAAHMFVFYFGIVADITPPVALAAYAGAAIAKSNPLKTGVIATRLAITAFIIPYIFAYSPAMLMIDPTVTGAIVFNVSIIQVLQIIITSLAGIFALSAGMEGYMYTKIPWWQRIILAIGGLTLIEPSLFTDTIGLVLISFAVLLQIFKLKKENDVKTLKKAKVVFFAACVLVVVFCGAFIYTSFIK